MPYRNRDHAGWTGDALQTQVLPSQRENSSCPCECGWEMFPFHHRDPQAVHLTDGQRVEVGAPSARWFCPDEWCGECDDVRDDECSYDPDEDESYCECCNCENHRPYPMGLRDAGHRPSVTPRCVRPGRGFPIEGIAPRNLATALGLRFGVELEVGSHDVESCVGILNRAGLTADRTNRNIGGAAPYWRVVHDGSVSNGAEVVSPPLPAGEDGEQAVAAAMRALRRGGVSVDRSCGMHVHFDAAPLGAAWVADYAVSYTAAQELMDAVLPPSRRGNNGWGDPYTPDELESLDVLRRQGQRPSVGRYKTVNTHALFRHGTVECRSHQGTLSPEKALAWIELQRSVIAMAAEDPRLHGENVARRFRQRHGDGRDGRLAVMRAFRELGDYGLSEDRASYLTERVGELSS